MAALPPGTNLAVTPAGAPPPGIVPDLVNGHSRGPVFLIFGPIITFICLCFLAARVYAKVYIMKSITPDDYACAFAAAGTLGYFAIIVLALSGGVFGKHIWDVSIAEISSNTFLKISYLSNWFPNPIWLAIKLTFYLLFLQIFRPNKKLCYAIWFGMAVTTLFYFSVTIPQIYWATPRAGQTWLDPLIDGETIKTQAFAMPIAGFNLASDIYIFLIPLWGLRKLQMSKRKKLGVAFIFATGFSAVVTSLVALIYKVQVISDSADYTWTAFPVLITNYTEMAVGLSAACMPACSATLHHHAQFFEDIASRVSRLTRSSASHSSHGTSHQSHKPNSTAAGPYVEITRAIATKKGRSDSTDDDIELNSIQNMSATASDQRHQRLPSDRIRVTNEVEQSWQRV